MTITCPNTDCGKEWLSLAPCMWRMPCECYREVLIQLLSEDGYHVHGDVIMRPYDNAYE